MYFAAPESLRQRKLGHLERWNARQRRFSPFGRKMKLWLVRHAQPLIAPSICYGRLDVAADAAASADCARRLALELPAGLRVAASPLQRCRQLAQDLQSLRPDLVYESDARLQEMDFGHWEGRAWQDIERAELQAWTDDFAHYAVGRTGESVTMFMDRVASAFDALGAGRAPGLKPQPPENATLWITHAGVIRAVGLLAQGIRRIERANQWPLQAPNYGQWQTLALHAGPAHAHEVPHDSAPRPGSACG